MKRTMLSIALASAFSLSAYAHDQAQQQSSQSEDSQQQSASARQSQSQQNSDLVRQAQEKLKAVQPQAAAHRQVKAIAARSSSLSGPGANGFAPGLVATNLQFAFVMPCARSSALRRMRAHAAAMSSAVATFETRPAIVITPGERPSSRSTTRARI
jgi:protein required for attachment to host cells